MKKLHDALMGVAIGDSFGLGLEFQSRDWIRQNVDFNSYVNKLEGKWAQNYKEGFYSDDTEHTFAVLEAICDERPFSEELLLEKFKEQYETDKKQKGFGRCGHGSIKRWYDGEKTIDEIRRFQASRVEPGNAPVMRSLPLGFLKFHHIDDYAKINANSTHPHDDAIIASSLISHAVNYLVVYDESRSNIIKYLKQQFGSNSKIKNVLFKIETFGPKLDDCEFEYLFGPQPIPSFKHHECIGVPNSSLRTAYAILYTLANSKDAFDGLKKAIRLGGDVDSVAAVTVGALAGKYGLSSLPSYLIEKVEGKDKIEALVRKVENFKDKKLLHKV